MTFRPSGSMLAERPMLTRRSMPAGRADEIPTGRSMPAGRADEIPTGRADDLPTGRSMPAGRADGMPTSKVDATETSDTTGKAGTSNSRNSGRSRDFGKHRNEEQSEVRLVRKTPKHRSSIRKTPKHRNFRPVRKHRKFDLSGRYPGTSTSGGRRVGGRCEIGDRNECSRREAGTKLRRTQVRREAWRDRSRRAEVPEEPQVELEGEC
jgi:hypothetical protein